MTAEAVLEKITIIFNVSLFKIVFSDSYTRTISILPFGLSISVKMRTSMMLKATRSSKTSWTSLQTFTRMHLGDALITLHSRYAVYQFMHSLGFKPMTLSLYTVSNVMKFKQYFNPSLPYVSEEGGLVNIFFAKCLQCF